MVERASRDNTCILDYIISIYNVWVCLKELHSLLASLIHVHLTLNVISKTILLTHVSMMSKYSCVTWFLNVWSNKLANLACLQDLRIDCADLRSKFQQVVQCSVCFVILKVQVYYKVRRLPSEQKHEISCASENAANTAFLSTWHDNSNWNRQPS